MDENSKIPAGCHQFPIKIMNFQVRSEPQNHLAKRSIGHKRVQEEQPSEIHIN